MKRFRLNRSQRGVAILETILVLPLLTALVFGSLEVGMLAVDSSAVQNALRISARIEGTSGSQDGADFYALQAIQDASTSMKNGYIDAVVIYSPKTDGSMPDTCKDILTKVKSSMPGCNYYASKTGSTFTDFSDYPIGDFSNRKTKPCPAGDDASLCPATQRDNSYSPAPDKIGIWIVAHHNSITDVAGSIGIQHHLIVQLDPDTRTAP